MKEFYYDSNACWGKCTNLKDIKEKALLQTDGPYGAFKTVDEFLDKSVNTESEPLSFGTRREHTGPTSLRMHLGEQGLLEDFLKLMEEEKCQS